MEKIYEHLISSGATVSLLALVGWFFKRMINTHDSDIKELKTARIKIEENKAAKIDIVHLEERIEKLEDAKAQHDEKFIGLKSVGDKLNEVLAQLNDLNVTLQKVEDKYQEQSSKTLKNRYRIDNVMRDIDRINGNAPSRRESV